MASPPVETITSLNNGVLHALRETEVSTMAGTSRIHHALTREERYDSEHLSIAIQRPENWESLLTRLTRHEPAMGCFDTSTLVSAGGCARDIAQVSIKLPGCEKPENLSIACFMAHLVHEDSVMRFDSSSDDEDKAHDTQKELRSAQDSSDVFIKELYDDGTWAGTLFWDAAIVLSEYLLEDQGWRETIRGARVVELGCGLGLPGFAAHLMGAGVVALTDRGMVADLCRENIELIRPSNGASNGSSPRIMACELEWTEDGASQLLMDLGGAPDLVLAADCIFMPVYGDSNPLMEILRQIVPSGSKGRVLLAAERRPRDGVDIFIQAAADEFTTLVVKRTQNTLIFEMKRLMA